MKLIIDIPEETFICLKNMIEAECVDPYSLADIIVNKGIPVSTEGDLISREALKEAIKNSFKHNLNGYDALLISEIDEFIDNAPTVLFPLTVKIKDNVTDDDIEVLKRLMKDYKPQVLTLETERTQGECEKCTYRYERQGK